MTSLYEYYTKSCQHSVNNPYWIWCCS